MSVHDGNYVRGNGINSSMLWHGA